MLPERCRALHWEGAALARISTSPTLQCKGCINSRGPEKVMLPSLNPSEAQRPHLAEVPGFLVTWAAMKSAFMGAQCCMGVNHLFAVYHAVPATV